MKVENYQILYKTYSGSKLYGLDEEGSDDDFIGAYMPNLQQFFGFLSLNNAKFEKGKESDTTLYSLQHFCKLISQGNFLVIESLFAPDDKVFVCKRPFVELRDMRNEFIGGNILVPMRGFIRHNSSHIARKPTSPQRLELFDKHGYDTKYAMHTIRLLDTCLHFIDTGEFRIDYSDLRDKYLDIKHGRLSYDECMSLIAELDTQVNETVDGIKRDLDKEHEIAKTLEEYCIKYSRAYTKPL